MQSESKSKDRNDLNNNMYDNANADEKLQNTTDTLESILNIARETKSIGADTMNELNRQGEHLQNVNKQLDDIDNDMRGAKQSIRKLEVKWYDPRTWI